MPASGKPSPWNYKALMGNLTFDPSKESDYKALRAGDTDGKKTQPLNQAACTSPQALRGRTDNITDINEIFRLARTRTEYALNPTAFQEISADNVFSSMQGRFSKLVSNASRAVTGTSRADETQAAVVDKIIKKLGRLETASREKTELKTVYITNIILADILMGLTAI